MPAMKIDVNVLLATIHIITVCTCRHAYKGTMIDYLTQIYTIGGKISTADDQ